MPHMIKAGSPPTAAANTPPPKAAANSLKANTIHLSLSSDYLLEQ